MEGTKKESVFYDLLLNIFRHLPTEFLTEVQLVNKQFYRVAAQVRLERGLKNPWLWIKSEKCVENIPLFQSMLKTKRIINKFAIGKSSGINTIDHFQTADDFLNDKWYFHAVFTVVGTCHGNNVKELQLMNVNISLHQLVNILQLTPNLTFLKLFFVNLDYKLKRLNNEAMDYQNMPKISDLIIVECSRSVEGLIEYLPPNTIKSLTVKTTNTQNLASVLKNQTSIFKMTLTGDDPFPLAAIKLTHLIISVKKNLAEFLAHQPGLVFLDTSAMIFDYNAFEAITRLLNVEKLSINAAGIGSDILNRINSMQNLKQFNLVKNTLESNLIVKP